jgi:hypothetical protein
VVSISGCDPLDPGSNPGTAITFFLLVLGGFVRCFGWLQILRHKAGAVRDVAVRGTMPELHKTHSSSTRNQQQKKVLHSVGLEPTPPKVTTT